MKRTLTVLLPAVCICALVWWSGRSAAPKVEIDYGTSELYSQEEIDAAIHVMEDTFQTWEGCELHRVIYGTDEACNAENIAWMNDLKTDGDSVEPFTQCMLLLSDFRSPKNGGGAWEANMEYKNWQWWLARTDDGAWELMTWGY